MHLQDYFAEFASMIPVAGCLRTICHNGRICCLDNRLGFSFRICFRSCVAVSWSQYVDKFLANYGIHIPQSILHGPWDTKPGIINLPSILIICLLSLLCRGTKESASLNNILVI
jgi:APA family basic amino acid/polyamine antiporter